MVSLNSKKEFVLLLFTNSGKAIDFYFASKDWKENDLWRIFLSFSFLAPLAKFLQNLTFYFLGSIFEQFELEKGLVDGLLSSWILVMLPVLLAYACDQVRMHSKFVPSTEKEPQPHLIFLSFLPFAGAGIFFVFPSPIVFLPLAASFLYCLQNSYIVLNQKLNYRTTDFFQVWLKTGIIFLALGIPFTFAFWFFRAVFQ